MSAASADGMVSVVVPVGRVDEALEEQLRALRAQRSTRAMEVVLARNTSEAPEEARLDELVESLGDNRFRVVPAADRRGASHARNVGAASASGSLLAFCDGDDVVHDAWLESIISGLDRFDAVGGRLIDIGLTERHRRARPPATPDDLPTFLGVPYMGSGNMAISSEVFATTGGFDEELVRCEDIALSWQLLVSGYRIGFVSDACIDYRHRPGTIPMIKQHFAYGRGMAQVLVRYGVPAGEGWSKPVGLGLLRPNPPTPAGASATAPGADDATAGRQRRSLLSLVRRASLAAGRVWGVAGERLASWRSQT